MTAVPSPGARARAIVASLRRLGTRRHRVGLARYGIPSDRALGVPMSRVQAIAKRHGKDHPLALALWKTEWREARYFAAFVAEPERLTPTQMDRWCRDFEDWAVCDTACFHLFDRSPHAFRKVAQWARREEEFVRRAAFALLASLALHDRETGDAAFRRCLPLITQAASDPRNFVKKAVSWALRGVGRRSRELHAASLAVARRLAASSDAAERWVGRDALRDLTRARIARPG